MVERVNFGGEDFDDDEFAQAKKIEAKDKKSEKEDKRPRVSLDSLFERKKIEEDDGPKKLEDLFVTKKPEAEDSDSLEEDDTKEDGALDIDHAEAELADTETTTETDGEQLDHQPELAGAETVEATRQMAEQRIDDLQAEQEQTDDPAEEGAILAAADLTENLLGKLDSAEEITDELLDETLAETSAELELSEPEEPTQEITDDQASVTETPSFETADETDDPALTPPPITPPPPPSQPPMPPGGGMPPSGAPVPPSSGFSPNFAPASPNIAPVAPTETLQDRHSHAPYVLAGGVVGYLLGRRRGRIKTEKQLFTVQKKLESEVNDLGVKLKEREDKIRALARQKHQEKPLDKTKVVESLNEKAEKRKEKRAQRPVIETVPFHANEVPDAESFGARPVAESLRRAETMTLVELLAVAGKVEFQRVSVKQMFEAGRLDINGLRRVVKEYMQGGNYERELSRSIKTEQLPASPETMNQLPKDNLQFDPNSQSLSLENQPPDVEQLAQQRYGLQSTTPEIGNYGSGPTTINTGTDKGKIAMAVGSVVAVVVLAVVVALILLAIT